MLETLKEVYKKWTENRLEGYFTQSWGGDPYVIMWVQGKNKPSKKISFRLVGDVVEINLGEKRIIKRTISEFTVDRIYPLTVDYVLGYPVDLDPSVYY